MPVTTIRNETPSQLTLIGLQGRSLTLAALQEKVLEDTSGFEFETPIRDGVISKDLNAPRQLGEQLATILLGGGFWLVPIGIWISNTDPRFGFEQAGWTAFVWTAGIVLLLAVAAVIVIRGTNSFWMVARFTSQFLALLVILAIGLGMPAATIYFFGDGHDLLAAVYADTVAAEPAPGTDETVSDADPSPATAPLALFGRLVQLAFIAIASLLPLLLFFLFDRFQLGTLRRRLYANLFRLEPELANTGEINAKYGSQITEAYGADDQGRGRLAPGSRWPVLVCAIVITIGWIVALAPVGGAFAPTTAAEALAVLIPRETALVYGFLGVYFFSLRSIAIRYARGDLKPKAYSYIMVRVLVVAVLSWVLSAIFDGESTVMLVLAFLFGITPDEFFTFVKERFRGTIPSTAGPGPTRLPLTDLDGIDLYDLGRLESEGIVNIEGLAHHELFDLIIDTRVPVPRLMDWIDQAILHLHLVGGNDTTARAILRDYGIRNATDFLRALDKAEERSKGPDGDPKEFENLRRLLGGDNPPYRLDVIRDALDDDEWMRTVTHWRENAERPPLTVRAVPSSAEALEIAANSALADRRYGDALKLLQQSLEVKDTASVRRRMATIHIGSPVRKFIDFDKARAHAIEAYNLDPDDIDGLTALAEIHNAMDDFDSARSMIKAALNIVSDWKEGKIKSAVAKDLGARLKDIDAQDAEAQAA